MALSFELGVRAFLTISACTLIVPTMKILLITGPGSDAIISVIFACIALSSLELETPAGPYHTGCLEIAWRTACSRAANLQARMTPVETSSTSKLGGCYGT